MSYRILRTSKRSKKVVVKFDALSKGIRHRQQITCYRSDVDHLYRRWLSTIESGNRIDLRGKRVKDLMPEYLAHAETTQRPITHKRTIHICDVLVGMIGDKVIAGINSADVEKLKWRLSVDHRDWAPATINLHLAILSGFMSWCQRQGYYDRVNPCQGKAIRNDNSRRIYLSPQDVADLLSKALAVSADFYLFVSLAAKAGLRRSEIVGLVWDEVDLDRGIILLGAERTKTKKAQVRYLTPDLVEIITKHPRISDRVLDTSAARYHWERIRPTLPDGSKLRLHDLRHVYGQTLYDSGVDISDIQHLMGHSSVRITQSRYVHHHRPDLGSKVQGLDKAFEVNGNNSGNIFSRRAVSADSTRG